MLQVEASRRLLTRVAPETAFSVSAGQGHEVRGKRAREAANGTQERFVRVIAIGNSCTLGTNGHQSSNDDNGALDDDGEIDSPAS